MAKASRAAQLREVVYRIRSESGKRPPQLSLILSAAAPRAVVETTVTHLDDEGDVWRTMSVTGSPPEVAVARREFDAYDPTFLVEKQVLGQTARRLILWYKYRPELVPGTSHTRLAFRLLGRDTVITDRARGGVLTIRVMARGGDALGEFLREAKRSAAGMGFELLYSGPPKEAGYASVTAAEEEALRAAFEAGYYGVPRASEVREVAKRAGVSPSTLSYRLRRAEAKLVEAFLEG